MDTEAGEDSLGGTESGVDTPVGTEGGEDTLVDTEAWADTMVGIEAGVDTMVGTMEGIMVVTMEADTMVGTEVITGAIIHIGIPHFIGDFRSWAGRMQAGLMPTMGDGLM